MWDNNGRSFLSPVQLYYDKTSTTLSANAMTFYPLRMTLLNFSSELRHKFAQSSDSLVAFLPVRLVDDKEEAVASRKVRMKLLQAAVLQAAKPLMDVAWKGFHFQDGDKILRRCCPCLGSYVADIPEAKDLTSTLHGALTSLPCPRCFVKSGDLAERFIGSPQHRTVSDKRRRQERARRLQKLID